MQRIASTCSTFVLQRPLISAVGVQRDESECVQGFAPCLSKIGPFCFSADPLADALGRQFVDHPERRHRQHGEPRRHDREHRGPLPQQRADGDRQPIECASQNDDPPQRSIARAAFEIRYVLRDPGRDIPGNGHACGQAQHRIQHEDDDLPRCWIGWRHGWRSVADRRGAPDRPPRGPIKAAGRMRPFPAFGNRHRPATLP